MRELTLGQIWEVFLEVYKDVCLVFTTAVLFGWTFSWIISKLG